MKVYDCFIFNNELDLLLLRLHFLNDIVDYFVIVESKRTLSGYDKPLYFAENKLLYSKFLHKIIYLEAPLNCLPAWDYEYFQRNYIKEGLKYCQEDDWVHISDADEILNYKDVIPVIEAFSGPVFVEMPMYYYWFNLESNKSHYNLVSRWKYLKNIDIGKRYGFPFVPNKIQRTKALKTGWHFSYLFGENIKMDQNKIESFSHQEYNKAYYLNGNRIHRCITLGIDLFERPGKRFRKSLEPILPLLPYIEKLKLSRYIYKHARPLSIKDIYFLIFSIYPKELLYYLIKILSIPFYLIKQMAKFFLKP